MTSTHTAFWEAVVLIALLLAFALASAIHMRGGRWRPFGRGPSRGGPQGQTPSGVGVARVDESAAQGNHAGPPMRSRGADGRDDRVGDREGNEQPPKNPKGKKRKAKTPDASGDQDNGNQAGKVADGATDGADANTAPSGDETAGGVQEPSTPVSPDAAVDGRGRTPGRLGIQAQSTLGHVTVTLPLTPLDNDPEFVFEGPPPYAPSAGAGSDGSVTAGQARLLHPGTPPVKHAETDEALISSRPVDSGPRQVGFTPLPDPKHTDVSVHHAEMPDGWDKQLAQASLWSFLDQVAQQVEENPVAAVTAHKGGDATYSIPVRPEGSGPDRTRIAQAEGLGEIVPDKNKVLPANLAHMKDLQVYRAEMPDDYWAKMSALRAELTGKGEREKYSSVAIETDPRRPRGPTTGAETRAEADAGKVGSDTDGEGVKPAITVPLLDAPGTEGPGGTMSDKDTQELVKQRGKKPPKESNAERIADEVAAVIEKYRLKAEAGTNLNVEKNVDAVAGSDSEDDVADAAIVLRDKAKVQSESKKESKTRKEKGDLASVKKKKKPKPLELAETAYFTSGDEKEAGVGKEMVMATKKKKSQREVKASELSEEGSGEEEKVAPKRKKDAGEKREKKDKKDRNIKEERGSTVSDGPTSGDDVSVDETKLLKGEKNKAGKKKKRHGSGKGRDTGSGSSDVGTPVSGNNKHKGRTKDGKTPKKKKASENDRELASASGSISMSDTGTPQSVKQKDRAGKKKSGSKKKKRQDDGDTTARSASGSDADVDVGAASGAKARRSAKQKASKKKKGEVSPANSDSLPSAMDVSARRNCGGKDKTKGSRATGRGYSDGEGEGDDRDGTLVESVARRRQRQPNRSRSRHVQGYADMEIEEPDSPDRGASTRQPLYLDAPPTRRTKRQGSDEDVHELLDRARQANRRGDSLGVSHGGAEYDARFLTRRQLDEERNGGEKDDIAMVRLRGRDGRETEFLPSGMHQLETVQRQASRGLELDLPEDADKEDGSSPSAEALQRRRKIKPLAAILAAEDQERSEAATGSEEEGDDPANDNGLGEATPMTRRERRAAAGRHVQPADASMASPSTPPTTTRVPRTLEGPVSRVNTPVPSEVADDDYNPDYALSDRRQMRQNKNLVGGEVEEAVEANALASAERGDDKNFSLSDVLNAYGDPASPKDSRAPIRHASPVRSPFQESSTRIRRSPEKVLGSAPLRPSGFEAPQSAEATSARLGLGRHQGLLEHQGAPRASPRDAQLGHASEASMTRPAGMRQLEAGAASPSQELVFQPSALTTAELQRTIPAISQSRKRDPPLALEEAPIQPHSISEPATPDAANAGTLAGPTIASPRRLEAAPPPRGHSLEAGARGRMPWERDRRREAEAAVEEMIRGRGRGAGSREDAFVASSQARQSERSETPMEMSGPSSPTGLEAGTKDSGRGRSARVAQNQQSGPVETSREANHDRAQVSTNRDNAPLAESPTASRSDRSLVPASGGQSRRPERGVQALVKVNEALVSSSEETHDRDIASGRLQVVSTGGRSSHDPALEQRTISSPNRSRTDSGYASGDAESENSPALPPGQSRETKREPLSGDLSPINRQSTASDDKKVLVDQRRRLSTDTDATIELAEEDLRRSVQEDSAGPTYGRLDERGLLPTQVGSGDTDRTDGKAVNRMRAPPQRRLAPAQAHHMAHNKADDGRKGVKVQKSKKAVVAEKAQREAEAAEAARMREAKCKLDRPERGQAAGLPIAVSPSRPQSTWTLPFRAVKQALTTFKTAPMTTVLLLGACVGAGMGTRQLVGLAVAASLPGSRSEGDRSAKRDTLPSDISDFQTQLAAITDLTQYPPIAFLALVNVWLAFCVPLVLYIYTTLLAVLAHPEAYSARKQVGRAWRVLGKMGKVRALPRLTMRGLKAATRVLFILGESGITAPGVKQILGHAKLAVVGFASGMVLAIFAIRQLLAMCVTSANGGQQAMVGSDITSTAAMSTSLSEIVDASTAFALVNISILAFLPLCLFLLYLIGSSTITPSVPKTTMERLKTPWNVYTALPPWVRDIMIVLVILSPYVACMLALDQVLRFASNQVGGMTGGVALGVCNVVLAVMTVPLAFALMKLGGLLMMLWRLVGCTGHGRSRKGGKRGVDHRVDNLV